MRSSATTTMVAFLMTLFVLSTASAMPVYPALKIAAAAPDNEIVEVRYRRHFHHHGHHRRRRHHGFRARGHRFGHHRGRHHGFAFGHHRAHHGHGASARGRGGGLRFD